MTIELTEEQTDLLRTCLADAMDELKRQLAKNYRDSDRKYNKILQSEYDAYNDVLIKLTKK